jgi:hypothetical protein
MKTIYKLLFTLIMFYSDYNDENMILEGKTIADFWKSRAETYKTILNELLKN